MIELKIEGCCRACEHIDLKLVSFGELNYVLCKHQCVCGKLEEERQKGADDEKPVQGM